ncbi:MAG: hypothetical protein WA058_03540 [Minisyncoccia bacterium]
MRPEGVNRAIHEGRHDILSAMGRKGAKKSAETKHLKGIGEDLHKAELAEDRAKLAIEQGQLYQVDPEGEVLPPDEIVPLE